MVDISNSITIKILGFEITSFSPVLSHVNGGGRLSIITNGGLDFIGSIKYYFNNAVYITGTVLNSTYLNWYIPRWPKANTPIINFEPLDTSVVLLGDMFSKRYCKFQRCRNEYLWIYILRDGDSDVVLCSEIINEHVNGTNSNVNLTNYYIGEELKDTEFYTIQASVDDRETWVDLYENRIYIKSQYSDYTITSISPSIFFVLGTQSASIVITFISSENATTYELLVVTNDQNFTYDVEKSKMNNFTVLISSHY